MMQPMKRKPKFAYILPAHNESGQIEKSVTTVLQHMQQLGVEFELLLVENGSSDATYQLCVELGEKYSEYVYVYREPQAGMGLAYRRGIKEMQRRELNPENLWVILGAVDIPFGFVEPEYVMNNYETLRVDTIIAASKVHPNSRAKRAFTRTVATKVLSRIRRIVLGIKTGDTQGTFVLPYVLATRFIDAIRADDFFFTTELIYLAERGNCIVTEIPVDLKPDERRSNVRLFRHGFHMILQTIGLRLRP